MSDQDQRFSSRIGLLLSVLGIAVGTGNIWRFPGLQPQIAEMLEQEPFFWPG